MPITRIRKIVVSTTYYEVVESSTKNELYIAQDAHSVNSFQIDKPTVQVVEPYRELTEAETILFQVSPEQSVKPADYDK